MEKKRVLEAVFIFLFSFFILSANIGGLYIYSLDEAKNSECAREMLEKGELIVPTFNYELRTDKPPLHYYFMMISYKIFGVSEFSARFFSSVFGSLLVLITFLFARRYLGFYTALFSVVALLSSIHFSVQFHMAVPDPYLIFWINASLFSFYVWFKEKREIFLYSFYLFTGLGVLTKGPVAIVLPGLIIVVFLFLTKNLNILKQMRIFQGILLTLFVSLPWYIAVYIKTDGKWIEEFIFKHNIHRFSAPMEGHGGIFLVTFLFVFVGMLPFSVFVVQALKNAWENRKDSLILFLFLIVVIYTGFFAVSKTKLPNYTVPVYPSLAILLGYYLNKIKNSIPKSIYTGLIFYIILSLLIVAGLYFGIKGEKEISDLSYLSFSFLLLTVGGISSIVFMKRDFLISVSLLSFFSILTSLTFFFYTFPKVDSRNPVAQMLPLINKKKDIRYYGSFNPAFVFYIRKHIPKIDKKDLKTFLNKRDTVFLLSRERYQKDILSIKNAHLLKKVKDLFENKTSILITNKLK